MSPFKSEDFDKRLVASGNTAPSDVALVEGAETTRVLEGSARRNSFARLGLPATGECSGAICWGFENGVFTLALDQGTDPSSLSVYGLSVVLISFEGLTYLGLSRVLGVRPDPSDTLLVDVSAPTQMFVADARASERAPVPEDCGLVTFLYHEDRLVRVKPVNVGLGGMLIHPPPGFESVNTGTVVQIQCSWDGLSATMPALVRWQDGRSFGLYFSANGSFGQPACSPEWTEIVGRLLRLVEPRQAA